MIRTHPRTHAPKTKHYCTVLKSRRYLFYRRFLRLGDSPDNLGQLLGDAARDVLPVVVVRRNLDQPLRLDVNTLFQKKVQGKKGNRKEGKGKERKGKKTKTKEKVSDQRGAGGGDDAAFRGTALMSFTTKTTYRS